MYKRQGEELISKCEEKNIGFIDMKPLAGGAIENGTLALRYVCSNKDVYKRQVELYTITFVYLYNTFIVYPRNSERDDSFRLNKTCLLYTSRCV